MGTAPYEPSINGLVAIVGGRSLVDGNSNLGNRLRKIPAPSRPPLTAVPIYNS